MELTKKADKESIYLLQKIDCNCNDCRFMIRDFDKMKSYDHLHIGQEKASHWCNYGHCNTFDKPVVFIANILQVETQDCFVHRRDITV